MHIYVNNPIRVDVHIACICEKEGVAQFMNRTRFYTTDCIYLYLLCAGIKLLKQFDLFPFPTHI